jgi:hypothetical protein
MEGANVAAALYMSDDWPFVSGFSFLGVGATSSRLSARLVNWAVISFVGLYGL